MMTKLKMIMAASALCLTAAGGLALAKDQGDPAKKPGLMQKFDANGDGVLDAGEKAKMKEAFAAKRAARKAARIARFDTNKDGALSPAERAAMRDEMARERFTKLDKNGDGQLSLDEFKAGALGRGGHHRGAHHRGGHFRGGKGGGGGTGVGGGGAATGA
jgi:hypothetical protein